MGVTSAPGSFPTAYFKGGGGTPPYTPKITLASRCRFHAPRFPQRILDEGGFLTTSQRFNESPLIVLNAFRHFRSMRAWVAPVKVTVEAQLRHYRPAEQQ